MNKPIADLVILIKTAFFFVMLGFPVTAHAALVQATVEGQLSYTPLNSDPGDIYGLDGARVVLLYTWDDLQVGQDCAGELTFWCDYEASGTLSFFDRPNGAANTTQSIQVLARHTNTTPGRAWSMRSPDEIQNGEFDGLNIPFVMWEFSGSASHTVVPLVEDLADPATTIYVTNFSPQSGSNEWRYNTVVTAVSFTTIDDAATLTLSTNVVNDNGGSAGASAWLVSADGLTPISGPGSVTAPISAGVYTLFADGPEGYESSDWSCNGGTLMGNELVIEFGEDVACTITHDDQPGTLTLIKTVVNDDGGTLQVSDFLLFVDATLAMSGVPLTLDADTYLASETPYQGYFASQWGGDCAPDGTVELSVGENLTCTITNNDAGDEDSDGITNDMDNCTVAFNPSQRDTDGDGHGNLCDGDFNSDCIVNGTDLGFFKSVFFTTNDNADLNGDGIVNSGDLGLFKSIFFTVPGPSALPNLCDN